MNQICAFKFLFVLLFNLTITSTQAQQYYSKPQLSKITFDSRFSPFMGADNAIAVRKGLNKIDEIDLNAVSLLGLLQHEYYGHVWAYRQFGYQYNSFTLSTLPPFGIGTGSAIKGELKQFFDSTGNQIPGISYNPPTLSEEILISYSGAMSQQVLADKLSQEFFISDSMDYRTSLLYLYNSRSISGMLLFNTGDMQTYSNQLNALYDTNNSTQQTLKNLKLRSLVSFVNFNDVMSFYNVFCNYLIKGETKMKTRSFDFIKFSYLPALRYTLTPFGGQYGISNYFKNNNINGELSFNTSDRLYNRYWDVNLEINYKKNNYSFISYAGFWH
jgi:hypothetical protein